MIKRQPDRSDEQTGERETRSRNRSRRSFLGGVAVAGLGAAALPSWAAAGRTRRQITPTTIAEFNPPNLPENIAIDPQGTLYLSMAPAGEIQQINPDDGSASTVASFQVGEGLLLGITTDEEGTIYAAVNSSVPQTHGVWRVTPDGGKERLASLPVGETQPNGIIDGALPGGDLLVTDHQRGAIWRVPAGGGEAQVWLESPLLKPNPYGSSVGVDGIAEGPNGDVWVDNLSYGAILRVPVGDDGSAGKPKVFVQNEGLIGSDGMTIDDGGNLYVAVNAQNKVVRITPEKNIQTLVSGGDLDFPADVLFGTTPDRRNTLYIANFAYANFLENPQTANPSLMSIEVGDVPATTERTTRKTTATETQRTTADTETEEPTTT